MTKEENEERIKRLKSIVSAMPESPGSYQFYDKTNKIIYVGKAKRLKNRVSSYFHTEVDRYKTKILVSKIFDISYTVTPTEEDALLLENNLIKEYQPKYNILLKDGKTYPSICVTHEAYPRIIETRNIDRNFGTYFGPYSHISTMKDLLEIIKKIYHPRPCRKEISKEGVKDGRYNKCIKYELNICEAPCINKISAELYNENIKDACEILKGNTREIEQKLTEMMLKKAENWEFEKAADLKRKRDLLRGFVSKSEVVSHKIKEVDTFSIEKNENIAFVNYIHVKNGSINKAFTFEYKNAENEDIRELLEMAIVEMRKRFESSAKEVIIPFELNLEIEGVSFTIPQKGEKKKLLEFSENNVKQYKYDRLKRIEKLNPEHKTVRLMNEIKQKLNLPSLPMHIECFDNSNISGTSAVGACIVYKKLKPSKKDYRIFNIKSVEGPDDYASMKEVARRRYTRILEEKGELPDLILTDGGKGQMEVVREVIEDELKLNIPIAGLVKNNRHRTNQVLIGFPPKIVGMDTKSEMFFLFSRIQEEVDRYAKSYHRKKRIKNTLHSELDNIKGIGPKSRDVLMKNFGSLKGIKDADIEKITEKIGLKKATILKEYFKNIE